MVEPRVADGGPAVSVHLRSRLPGRARMLGMAVTDLANPFFADVLRSMEAGAAAAGYGVRIGDSGNDPERETEHLRGFERHRLRGVLLAPIGVVPAQVGRLRNRGIPVVLVDRGADDTSCCVVAVDDVVGGRLAVAHLTGRGHRRIAFVGGPGSLPQVRDRLLGAKLASATYGDRLRLRTVLTTVLDVPAGRKAAATLAALPPPERPTAVFAANDLLAIGLLHGLTAAGLRVPEDLALVGYDDIGLAATTDVPLTTVRQPRSQLGQQAVELLVAEIAAAAAGTAHEHRQVRFLPELVVRASSASTLEVAAAPG